VIRIGGPALTNPLLRASPTRRFRGGARRREVLVSQYKTLCDIIYEMDR